MKKLVDSGADSEESARSLSELGVERKWMLARSLREGSVLRRMVKVAVPSEVDLSVADSTRERYYIPTEDQTTAQKRFRVKGNGVGSLLICIAGLTLALLLFLVYGPWLFGILDSFIASMKGM